MVKRFVDAWGGGRGAGVKGEISSEVKWCYGDAEDFCRLFPVFLGIVFSF